MRLYDQHISTGNQDYEKMLGDTLDLAGIPDSHKIEGFDPNSAIMRTYLLLASTMIHEFAWRAIATPRWGTRGSNTFSVESIRLVHVEETNEPPREKHTEHVMFLWIVHPE